MGNIIFWQSSSALLYVLGSIFMMRLIYLADIDMTKKSNGIERVLLCVLWPILAAGCAMVLSWDWLWSRKK